MAWNTGLACGFTATRSSGRSASKYNAVITVANDADDDWWPPTFNSSSLGRRWLALWMVHVASHSALRSSAARIAALVGVVAMASSPHCRAGCIRPPVLP